MNMLEIKDMFVENFEDELFTTAFKKYFGEISTSSRNWGMLFRQMNAEKGTTRALISLCGNSVVGFIMFCEVELKCLFFVEKIGYIREFWVDSQFRGKGHGHRLLKKAEEYFYERNIKKTVLNATKGTEAFYIKNGYSKSHSIVSDNRNFFEKICYTKG